MHRSLLGYASPSADLYANVALPIDAAFALIAAAISGVVQHSCV